MAGMSIEEMYGYMEMKYRQFQMSYTLDINEYVRKVASRVSTNLLIRKKGILPPLSELEKEILEAIPSLVEEDIVRLYHEFNRIENELPANFYKREFIVLHENNQPFLYSTLMKMLELNNNKFEGFKKYHHHKFYSLSHFVHTNEQRE